MKLIIYYILLLVFVALIGGFLLANPADVMGMRQMLPVAGALVLYTVAVSLVGEWKLADEREIMHRYFANRAALTAGTVFLSLGLLIQLFNHRVDYWLLAGLVVINLVKIVSLIYLNYKK